MFGTILISVCTLMHIYVFWRISSIQFIERLISGRTLIAAGFIIWAIFFFGRVIGHSRTGSFSETLEFLGMTWMGILFLIFVSVILVDILTLFGLLMPGLSSKLRGWALLAGLILSAIALFQGMRAPVIEKYEVKLSGLPPAMDGKVIIVLSDMHLGSLSGEHWLAARIAQINAEKPDLVVLLGDIFEGHGPPEDLLIRTFKKLSAPLGIIAVAGNHEFHGAGKISLFEEPNFKLLSNEWVELVPGLILAGVEDLTANHRNGGIGNHVSQALSGRPKGVATIFLSHTPWQAEKAAKAGAGLMLCGHTHGGQIWPFGYFVRKRYPLFEGRYEVDGMTVIVCRGTGTWGPRMRLWRPSEILRVTLRNK